MLTTGIPQIVAGIAVFLVCGVLLFAGKVRKRYWCLSCLVTALLVGRGVWCANDFFDLGMGTPKVFSPENWEKNEAGTAAFHGGRPARADSAYRYARR